MLTTPEKILFTLLAIATIYIAYQTAKRIIAVIGRGQGKPEWLQVPKRLLEVTAQTVTLSPVWRARPLASLLHAFVAWGFIFYILVNIGDLLEGYIADFSFMGNGLLGNLYRGFSDIFTVGVLVGMLGLILRRFVFKDPALKTRESTLLHPKAAKGKTRDSLIVGIFVLTHIGFRLIGESFQLALHGADRWQLFANALSGTWLDGPSRL